MRTARSLLFVFGSAAVLALGACSSSGSGGGSEPSPSSTRVATSVSPSVPATVQPATTPQNTDQSSLPRGMEVYPGAQVQIGNDQATVCVNGDGWRMNVIAVNGNTSCEFAYAVSDGMVGTLNATEDNIRDHLPKSFQATSGPDPRLVDT
ncbi:hypothetical protein ACXZ66_03555 [Corynebacterium sp. S7]